MLSFLLPPLGSLARSALGALAGRAPWTNKCFVVARADIPRKCSATNRLIPAGDHASVQFNSAPARIGPARFALLAGCVCGH